MRIGCLGMTTLDNLLFTEFCSPKGEEIERVHKSVTCLGGKGMVTAVSLSALKHDVILFTLLAKQAKAKTLVLQRLPKSFCTQHVHPWLLNNNKTWIICSARNGTRTFFEPGGMSRVRSTAIQVAITRFLSQIDVLYFSAEETPVMKTALPIAAKAGLPVVSNLSMAILCSGGQEGRSIVRDIVNKSTTLIMNKQESHRALLSLGLSRWAGLTSPTLREIIVTDGRNGGSMSVAPFEYWNQYHPQGTQTNPCTVGAGDTFCGAYVAARYLLGCSLSESCKFASNVAGQKLRVKASTIQGL